MRPIGQTCYPRLVTLPTSAVRSLTHADIPRALALGAAGSLLGGWIGTVIAPTQFAIGDTNPLATAVCAWAFLGLARLFRIC